MIGHRCTIKGTELAGLVVGCLQYAGNEKKYAVRYIDNSGPQERWFQVSQLEFSAAQVVSLSERRSA